MTQALDGGTGDPSESDVPDELLQPEYEFTDIVPATANDLANLPFDPAWKQLTDELERLERHLTDAQIIEELRAVGFIGPAYDLFETELARYGLGVSQGWLYNGHFFAVAAKRGFGVGPTPEELTILHEDREARSSLANMVVGRTMPMFKQCALVDGGWQVDGGAGINTYFMGATAFTFPNEYRSWKATLRRWGLSDAATQPTDLGDGSDERVAMDTWINRRLSKLKPEKRELLKLDALGYTNAQIGEKLGLSARAVEGRLYRLRLKCQKMLSGEVTPS